MATADTSQAHKHSNRRRNRSHTSSRMENDFVPSSMNTNEDVDSAPVATPHRKSRSRPTKQLDFHQAMSDFKTMFPMMDNEVIEAVLRANDGAVDATIDQLLTMSIDVENSGDESPVHVSPHLITPVSITCSCVSTSYYTCKYYLFMCLAS